MVDIDRLEMNMREARLRLDQPQPSKTAKSAVENKYGEAYQALVRAGMRSQIKHKYRISKH